MRRIRSENVGRAPFTGDEILRAAARCPERAYLISPGGRGIRAGSVCSRADARARNQAANPRRSGSLQTGKRNTRSGRPIEDLRATAGRACGTDGCSSLKPLIAMSVAQLRPRRDQRLPSAWGHDLGEAVSFIAYRPCARLDAAAHVRSVKTGTAAALEGGQDASSAENGSTRGCAHGGWSIGTEMPMGWSPQRHATSRRNA